MTPTTADIRRFLVDTFSDEDLKTLCFDYFRDVYDDFTTGMTKGQMIQLLIERCVRRDALANLEAALRAERPDQYVKQFGAPTPPPVSSFIPAEIAPAGRDPRQVFISHAHQDADFAHRLAADLVSAGWRAWIAPESIQPGEKWVEAIGRGLDGSGVFVVALTPAAVASNWVRNETNAAIELDNRGEVQFIPLDLAACSVPTLWNVYQRVPFRGRYEDGLAALLRRLGMRAEEGETGRRVDKEIGRQGDRETSGQVDIKVAAAALASFRRAGAGVDGSLLDAYDEGSLRQMVRFQLDEHLDLIAGGGNLAQVVFNLIAWAERTGRIAELIVKAQAYNPGNARLAAFARSVPGIAVVEPAKVAPQVLPATPQAPTPRAAAAAGPIAFDWVTIPAGEFLMGSDKTEGQAGLRQRDAAAHALPARVSHRPRAGDGGAVRRIRGGDRPQDHGRSARFGMELDRVGVGGDQRRRLGAPPRAGEQCAGEAGPSRHLRLVARRRRVLQMGRRAAAHRGGMGEGRARDGRPHLAVGESGAEQRAVQLQHDRGRHDAGGPLS